MDPNEEEVKTAGITVEDDDNTTPIPQEPNPEEEEEPSDPNEKAFA